MKVGQQGVRQAAQEIGKRAVRENTVATDAQNLGVELFEPGNIFLERDELSSSSVGEVERKKSQHHYFPA